MELKINWRVGLILIGVLLAVGYVGWSWYAPPDKLPVTGYVEAKSSGKVKAEQKKTIPIREVKVLPKASVRKLDLPESVQQDTRQQVLTAVDVAPSEAGAVAVTLIDTETGNSRTLVQAKPVPFFAFEKTNELGIRYGVSSKEELAGEVYYRRDVLRIGRIHVGVCGSLDSAGLEARGMLSLAARW